MPKKLHNQEPRTATVSAMVPNSWKAAIEEKSVKEDRSTSFLIYRYLLESPSFRRLLNERQRA